MNLNLHLKVALLRLTGLLRARVILSLIGMYAMYKQPSVAHWIFSITGLALGVSAVDAYHEGRRNQGEKR